MLALNGPAYAEICDKGGWSPGDLPSYLPWTGWPVLLSPFFIGLGVFSVLAIFRRVSGHGGGGLLLVVAIVWFGAALVYGVLIPLLGAEDPSNFVIQGMIREGCLSVERSGIELIIIQLGMAGLLGYLAVKRPKTSIVLP
jgi:hypothetical protein